MALSGRTHLYMQLAHPVEHVRVNRLLNPILEARGIDAMVVPIHDIVIADGGTPLERAARARGCRTLGGMPMLQHQLDGAIVFFQAAAP